MNKKIIKLGNTKKQKTEALIQGIMKKVSDILVINIEKFSM